MFSTREPTSGDITVTPVGNISATTIQAAIAELDTEKASKTGAETLENKTLKDPVLTLDSSTGGSGAVLVAQGSGLPPKWEDFSSSTQTLTNKTIDAGVFTNGYTEETSNNSGTSFTFDFANGSVQAFSTTGNATITLPAVAVGKSFQIQIAFGGSHTLGFTGGAVAWSDNTTPTFSGATGKTDVINFVANVAGTKWLGALHSKGYV